MFIKIGAPDWNASDSFFRLQEASLLGGDEILYGDNVQEVPWHLTNSTFEEPQPLSDVQVAVVFSVLTFFCLATIFGNVLVIVAVIRQHYLHSPTNYFIVSLACADFLLGTVVMPFQAIFELLGKRWIFGEIWCDIWRALDVLLATASILNLCVISLDRYWAISEPFSYPSKMTSKTSAKLIAGVWICSTVISLPAILWWRATRKAPFPEGQCLFTDDAVYLLASSCVSFYIPLFVMLFTYLKIYQAAVRQTRSIRLGGKLLFDKDQEVTLRMHRGGRGGIGSFGGGSIGDARASFCGKLPGFDERQSLRLSSPAIMDLQRNRNYSEPSAATASILNAMATCVGPTRVNFKPASRGSIIKRKISKFSKEKKAAKTLAIVLGVFILCWLPFFAINLVAGLCPSCRLQERVVFDVVTWLGWVNSGMNPIIYAAWNRDFRRAFVTILCCSPCCKIQVPLPRFINRFR